MTSFVQLERYNAIRLVQHVHGSLAALSKVIKGTALLTAETQNLATSLMKQEVVKPSFNIVSKGFTVVCKNTCF